MMGFFDDLFDLNSDGKMDAFERTMEYVFLTEEIKEAEEPTELECSGLDPDELEWMSSEDRKAALEDAGLDPEAYDF